MEYQTLVQGDSQIEQVVIQSKFVVAYHLQQEGPTPGWRKANIEGPVFVVRRSTPPRYQLIVKNHQDGTSDLVDDLHPDWEMDCQSKYIFYKVEDPSKKIRGLWFHEDSERIRVEKLLENLLQELRSPPAPQPVPVPPAAPQVQAMPAHQPQAPTHAQPQPAVTPAPAPGSVTITPATVRAALHRLADDDNFLRTIMDHLAKAQAAG
mmetsp:Transcript_110951/g.320676  ORF Transcript_110951/g.320676 Transcript_110951/m.320676 type:complete len:207 (+) Transcript_110951:92-712(+)